MTRVKKRESAYYLFAEAKLARQHAERVKEFETQNKAGAWGEWQAFIDRWPVDSKERNYLNEIFSYHLDILDSAEHDPLIRDIW